MLGAGYWVQAQRIEAEQQMRRLLVFSALVHFALVLALALDSAPVPLRSPPSLTVDLIASLPLASPPPPAASPTPTPTPAPAPAVRPKPKVKILPKRAPAALAKPKAKPKPAPAPVLRRRTRPKELAYDDALAQLRGEIGEAAPAPRAEAPAKAAAPAAQPSRGIKVSPELLAWHLAVKRRVRADWVMLSEFRDRGLAAEVVIDVASDGRILGRPEIVTSSGNPFYDDNAIRALARSSPLPPPPKAGRRTLVFTPEE